MNAGVPTPHFLKAAVTPFIIVVGIGLIASLQQSQLTQLRSDAATPSPEVLEQLVDAQQMRLTLLKRTPTFGYDNLIADWAFLNFLQYFGDEPARQVSGYRLSPSFFDVIVTRNPYFLQAYSFLSTSVSIYAGMPEQAVALMQQGLQSLGPTTPVGSHFVWRNKAVDELLFLGDSQAAQASFEMAAEWAIASNAPGSENAANLSRQTAAFLAQNPDSRMAQVASWMMVLTNAADDRTRETAIERIEALGGQIIANPDGTFAVQPPTQD